MPLFDRYIAVDWSAANVPTRGKDSIWIGDASRSASGVELRTSLNPTTRDEAMQLVVQLAREALSNGHRLLFGFDFPFGYPANAAARIAGTADWRQLWSTLSEKVIDDQRNASNRFAVADGINATLGADGPLYWGHPPSRSFASLSRTRSGVNYAKIGEKRIVETRERAKSVWQLNGAGSVGGQAITGIARLERLLRESGLRDNVAVWPFETDFERELNRPIVISEIYPSMFAVDSRVTPNDRAQVEAVAHGFAELDARGQLGELLSSPSDLSAHDRAVALVEEGWIVGSGHDGLRRSVSLPSRRAVATPTSPYLRDPDAIYAQSFATIEAEADLSQLPPELHQAAIRMIHACGMVDLAGDITGDATVVSATRTALAAGAPVFCDCEMVRSGVIRRFLPAATELVVTLNDPSVPALARSMGTTRSAAAVELWRPRLADAVVLIGNAPTALFHLLELIEAGGPRPAAIIAAPVGFVGAAESKALLASSSLPIPYLTVLGRRGGSAIASAALNAISRE